MRHRYHRYPHTSGLIESVSDLIQNIRTVESYLKERKNSKNYKGMAAYIQRGHNFVAYIVDGEYHFAPSGFLGYKDNTLDKHAQNISHTNRNGIETSRIISYDILSSRIESSDYFEARYKEYCKKLGVDVPNRKRTYWSIENDFESVISCDEKHFEGKIRISVHERRERDPEVVKKAKELFKSKHNGRLYCEICDFDFARTYGMRGEDFIHAHHIVPVSMHEEEEYEIRAEDFIMVCPNCHAMLHRPLDGNDYADKEKLKAEMASMR